MFMAQQPIRKTKVTGPFNKPRSKAVKKKKKPQTVGEIIKKNIEQSKKPHPRYGSSKLENHFAKEFLDKLGVKYERQYYAESIKRYYDFYLPDWNLLIEVDGDYYHSKGLVYEDMSPMQKRNNRVDKLKNEWAVLNGYNLIRVWESDINKNATKLMEKLKEILMLEEEKRKKREEKKKRRNPKKKEEEEKK